MIQMAVYTIMLKLFDLLKMSWTATIISAVMMILISIVVNFMKENFNN